MSSSVGVGSMKSWLDIRQAVRKSHRSANTVACRVPHNLTLETNGHLSRLYFLSIPSGLRENTILYVDSSPDTDSGNKPSEWLQLLDSFQPSTSASSGPMSREEQLLRERKRLRSYGITGYDYQRLEKTSYFAFSASNSLFMCADVITDAHQSQVCVQEVKTSCDGSRIDPKICPSRPDLLAFVSGLDIWVTCVSSGCEKRLTFAHKGLKNLVDDPVGAGVPSFVVQEEFNRFTGYWWQPQSSSSNGVYKILYEEVDESEVEILNILIPQKEGAAVDQYRYPKAGTANAKCTLKIVEFTVDDNGIISNVVDRQLPLPLAQMFPWMEYLVRAGWLPDGSKVYAEIMNRRQTRLQLVLFDLENFAVPVDDGDDDSQQQTMMQVSSSEPSAGGSGHVWTLYEDTSSYWINVNDLLYFYSKDRLDGGVLQFIWSSAKSGFSHLYHVTVSLDSSDRNHVTTDGCALMAKLVSEVQLTDGDWDVDPKQIWVNEENRMVYFVGYKDTPLETHLYCVSLDQPRVVFRLTKSGFSHSITMNKSCTQFATVYSSLSMPPACDIYHVTHAHVVTEQAVVKSASESSSSDVPCWKPPELFSYCSSCGATIYGMMYLPDDLDVTKKYPIVLFVYAGPHVQLVTNSYKALRFLRLHTLAALGYVVAVIDSRGSCNRGVQFEGHVHLQLGQVEVADQVEGLTWLAEKYSFIDMSRVAIHGWSYGGYISLMGLVQRPDIFKVAVAGAPVTSWHLYDTGYTERFLDLPLDNPSGYSNSSVLELADRFPNEDGRLLLVHGLIDENVHFYHTSRLVDALVKAGKPHQLQMYPNERHGIRSPEANEHYETLLINFLMKNL